MWTRWAHVMVVVMGFHAALAQYDLEQLRNATGMEDTQSILDIYNGRTVSIAQETISVTDVLIDRRVDLFYNGTVRVAVLDHVTKDVTDFIMMGWMTFSNRNEDSSMFHHLLDVATTFESAEIITFNASTTEWSNVPATKLSVLYTFQAGNGEVYQMSNDVFYDAS